MTVNREQHHRQAFRHRRDLVDDEYFAPCFDNGSASSADSLVAYATETATGGRIVNSLPLPRPALYATTLHHATARVPSRGRADSETPLAAVDRRLDPREHLRKPWTISPRRFQLPPVSPTETRSPFCLICTETDSPTGIHVFRGICQQIRDDLRDPQGVYDDRCGSFRHFDAQGMAARVMSSRAVSIAVSITAASSTGAFRNSSLPEGDSRKCPADRPAASPCAASGGG